MIKVLGTSWPLLAGVMLLMVGNGIQGSLLGIRGALEGFSTYQMSIVMAGYFLGFLGGSRLAPVLIQRVGHVRVFAALGSLISAVLVLYPVAPEVWSWTAMRILIGFCFSGVYVTAESWLNNASTNETRGQALSAYMIVQMIGIIASQVLLNVGDPSGFIPFILPSVLVSLAFLPILLSASPAPVFDTTQRMGFARLFAVSPLGCAGMLLTGGVYAAMMGMAGVWGMTVGLTVPEISIFVGAMYAGGLVLQFPVGWLSDRMDRRRLILLLSLAGAAVMLLASLVQTGFALLVVIAVLLGGIVNPIYALLIAHTNDFLPKEEMAGASAGLLFLNGLGAVVGPLATGWMMDMLGPSGFFAFIALLLGALGLYVGWRMTRRETPPGAPGYHPIAPTASAIAVEAVMERGSDG
ncbi:Major Facilitator Superfamily protein [Gemmobacter megaterium]|uniref:Major Facilitator Superfamily protein n=1 Tax=Gemmobacter megaterium TaxID=1086013 RepID=A0A1N7NTF4_9RHOB|nr:MFS transporter [Gemmobacter megaterium]GGE16745.1 MFS transporter [Gemmobacter megaterium]SIT01590.1 Major Facilitator Superfamily protein [Gemmobacter megaterium]